MNAFTPARQISRTAVCAAFVAITLFSAATAISAPKLTRADLEVVDCLLPGQVRVLGTGSYLTARRPIKTNARDCRIRGGEYVDFDRASMKDALKVWQEAADRGDAEAQNNVGEIYERGLGVEPNYQGAAVWYQKAADQGYSRAQFNLGTLYEQGLGVPADKLHALDLYRQSWGLPADSVMFRSAAREEQEALAAGLEKTIEDQKTQIDALSTQIGQMKSQIEKLKTQLGKQKAAANPANANANANAGSNAEVEALNRQVDSLKKLVDSIQVDRDKNNERLVALRTPTMGAAAAASIAALKPAEVRKALGVDFGRYYALIIGNQHYQAIDNLQTPISDAERAARVLKDRYGFSVRVLEDADDMKMLTALNDLNSQLKEGDNLIIYFAGHGTRLQTGARESGYWLGVNANPPPNDTLWVPNEQITAQLARLPARRVLVVADSCYAGLLSTDPTYRFVDAKAGYTLDYVKYKMPKRSRLLLSSGGDEPVLDKTSGSKNSVFAEAFLQELETNTSVLSVPELFSRISKRVEAAAARNNFVQKPEFKSIKGAGHDMGDFFFVPKS